MQRILARLFVIAYPRYVDDLFGLDGMEEEVASAAVADVVGPSGAAAVARFVVSDLLGWELDLDKSVTNAISCVILGLRVDIDDAEQSMSLGIEESKLKQWLVMIETILGTRKLSPAMSRTLAGKLSWGASNVFGRGARVYLAPLFHHAAGSSWQVPSRLLASLQWWMGFLRANPQRVVPLAPPQRCRSIVYSDATGDGNVAWVAQIGGRIRQWSATSIPSSLRKWVCHRKTQIATWELVAAVCAFWAVLDDLTELQATELHLFVDSTSALGCLMRGSARRPDWNALVQHLWFETARRGILLLGWWVPSALNLADAPTRQKEKQRSLQALLQAGFSQTPWKWPASVPWTGPMKQ